MAKKKSSLVRVFNQFKGKSIEEISQIQAFSSIKDANSIKKILNKPNISDESALGLGRLSNQYIALISNPTKNEIKTIKKSSKIELTNKANFNMFQAQNSNNFETIAQRNLYHISRKKKQIQIILDNPSNSDIIKTCMKIENNMNRLNISNFRLFINVETNVGMSITLSTSKMIDSNKIILFLQTMQKMIDESFKYDYEKQYIEIIDINQAIIEVY